MKAIGSEQILSTSHHQQTDGQTERKIQELQAYYRHFLSYDQENWIELTPIAQMALNDVISTTTNETPKFIVYGNQDGHTNQAHVQPESYTALLPRIHEQVKLDIAWNQQRAKLYYDQKRTDTPKIPVNSFVYLRRRTLNKKEYNIKSKRNSDKLDSVHLGPFKVESELPNDNYKLELPARMRIHPIFHVSLLKPTTNQGSEHEDEAFEEFSVEAILGRRINDKGKTEYLVKWEGYAAEEASWEETTNLFCPELVREFEETDNPRKRRKRVTPKK
jgi:hypothetical protein